MRETGCKPRTLTSSVLCKLPACKDCEAICPAAACALLREHGLRNFSFYLVGVGLRESTRAKMQELCAPDSAHFVDCGSDYGSVKKAIEQAAL